MTRSPAIASQFGRFLLGLALVLVCPASVLAFGGSEHSRITAAAVEALDKAEREFLAPEATTLASIYCNFPDCNHLCFGEWGNGDGDPRKPRLPDTRREWDISYYCSKRLPHKFPESVEAATYYFDKATESLRVGQLADGARYLGILCHYVEDTAAFGHLQPIHRSFHPGAGPELSLQGYTPRLLGKTPDEAVAALAARVRELNRTTEARVAPLVAAAGVSLDEIKHLSAKELMPAAAVEAVNKLKRDRAADFHAAAVDCAKESGQLCADVLHSAIALSTCVSQQAASNARNKNLVFNPSFEEQDDTEQAPSGWYVGWLDLQDRAGRAERYHIGTHWDKAVKSGQYSTLVLWAPEKGLEWRQNWRRAIPVASGETYRGSVWAKTRAASGATCFTLEFCDTAYRPLRRVQSQLFAGDCDWRRVSVEARVPDRACWLRVVLRSESSQGAVWFDDVEVLCVETSRP